jgi:hypothetical protein
MESKLDSNPWRGILTKPRVTIKAIVGYDPNYHLLLLSMIYGFSAILGIAQNLKLGEKLDIISIIIPALLISPIWGYLFFSISSWFVFFTGKWLGGKAEYKHIRAALAWSHVPTIVTDFLWILMIIFFGKALFQDLSKVVSSTLQIWGLFSILFLLLIASIWSIVIYINTLSEVQKFSILRTISNLILSTLLVAIIAIIIALVSKWTCSAFFNTPLALLF